MYRRNKNDTSARDRSASRPKRSKSKNRTGIYKGIEYESFEEKYMLMWLFELKAQGYIKHIERAKGYLLSEALIQNYTEQLKTKSNPKTQMILHGHSYTPEFIITWDIQKSRDRFTSPLGEGKKIENPIISQGAHSVIEVKPMFDQNSMERLFKVNQKWMWQKLMIFVNLVKVQELFPRTFTPKDYLVTDTGQRRKIKWRPRSLYEYISKGQ